MTELKLPDSQYYIKKGYMDSNDDVAFKRIFEACNCFGHSYRAFYRGGAKHPYRDDVTLWFPKTNSPSWINLISEVEKTIYERPKDPNQVEEHMNFHISSDIHNRIVFLFERDLQGNWMYRFKGEYQLNVDQSRKENCLVWKRIAERVTTYPPIR
jgi:hypothetical protein